MPEIQKIFKRCAIYEFTKRCILLIAQLSQRDRAMLCVSEYFAKSL